MELSRCVHCARIMVTTWIDLVQSVYLGSVGPRLHPTMREALKVRDGIVAGYARFHDLAARFFSHPWSIQLNGQHIR